MYGNDMNLHIGAIKQSTLGSLHACTQQEVLFIYLFIYLTNIRSGMLEHFIHL